MPYETVVMTSITAQVPYARIERHRVILVERELRESLLGHLVHSRLIKQISTRFLFIAYHVLTSRLRRPTIWGRLQPMVRFSSSGTGKDEVDQVLALEEALPHIVPLALDYSECHLPAQVFVPSH